MSGAGESKAGYLSVSSHAKIAAASSAIMKHAKIVQSELSALEAARHRSRAADLAGWPVYGSASDTSGYLTKEEEEDLTAQLKLINTSLEWDAALKEGREVREGMDPLQQLTRNVESALARVVESKGR
jgi:hypothetical protein